MTAATVLLSFRDTKAAARFVRALYAEEPTYEHIGEAAFAGEVSATVMRPTEWCECAGQKDTVGRGRRRRGAPKRELSWTKDPKTGWFVCVHCGRPAKALVVHAISAMLVGAVDHTPAILHQGPPRTLFDQRVMEVVEWAIAEGSDPDVESLTAYEKQYLTSMPESIGDPRNGHTALNGGGTSRRSQKVERTGKRQRPRRV